MFHRSLSSICKNEQALNGGLTVKRIVLWLGSPGRYKYGGNIFGCKERKLLSSEIDFP